MTDASSCFPADIPLFSLGEPSFLAEYVTTKNRELFLSPLANMKA